MGTIASQHTDTYLYIIRTYVVLEMGFQMDRRISAFIERKQKEVDDTNVREFCGLLRPNSEGRFLVFTLTHQRMSLCLHIKKKLL